MSYRRSLRLRPRFHPFALGRPYCWFDASTLSEGLTSTVQTWRDLSGYGRDATQATAGNRPTVAEANDGGGGSLTRNPKVLSFDGGDSLRMTAFTSLGTTSVFVVAKLQNSDSVLIDGSNATGRNLMGATSGGGLYYFAGTVQTGSSRDSNWYVYEARFNGADSYYARSGVVMTTGNPGAAGFIGYTIGGSSAATPASLMTGEIAEILTYPILTRSQAARVRFYLADKWGLSVAG